MNARRHCTQLGAIALLAGAALASRAGAQDDGLLFIVRAPGVAVGTMLDISVNRIVRVAELPATREVSVTFPSIAEGLVTVRILSQRAGVPGRVWTNEVRLNGSGVIDYRLNPNGTGVLGQWPAVTWLASKGTLDVIMNGMPLGTTKIRTRVQPDQQQRVEWRLDGAVVCVTTVKIAMNARRTYSCDPATKVVSQP